MKTSLISKDKETAVTEKDWLLRAWVLGRTRGFSCFLDELGSELVPPHARLVPIAPAEGAELIVNTSFRYQPGIEPPSEVLDRGLHLSGFLRGYPLAWVKDQGSALWMPFWVRDKWVDVLQSLRPGQSAPSELRSDIRHTLAMANILVPRGYEEVQRSLWKENCQTVSKMFRSKGYAIVRDVLPPFQLAALGRYYRALLSEDCVPKGDWIPKRSGLHSEMM